MPASALIVVSHGFVPHSLHDRGPRKNKGEYCCPNRPTCPKQRSMKGLSYENDVKLSRLKELLSTDLKGKKVLVFSYYKDTTRYLYKHIGHPDSPHAVEFCKQLGGTHVRRMDSGASPKDRVRIVQHFAPKSNNQPDLSGSEKEIDILISTDVLSDGQNLQDCGFMINYDLHWKEITSAESLHKAPLNIVILDSVSEHEDADALLAAFREFLP